MALENKARQFPLNVIHGGKRVVVFGQAAGNVELVCIPKGAFLKGAYVDVTEAFNGTGATIDVGTAATPNGIAASAAIAPATVGYKGLVAPGPLCGDRFFAQDTVIVIAFAPGTGGTTGRAAVVVEFYPQQD